MQVGQGRAEKGTGLVEGFDTPLDQQIRQNPVNPEFRRQPPDFFRIGRFHQIPFLFCAHTLQSYALNREMSS